MAERDAYTEPTEDWLYYRLYVREPEDLERLLRDHMRPLLQRLSSAVTDARWFFLNYADGFGPHVRLRVRAFTEELTLAEQVIDAALPSIPLVRDAQKAVYTPETWKFGTGAAMAAAEEVFWRGSEAALLCAESHAGNLRIVHGAAHTRVMAGLLPRPLRLAFLHHYAWYWSGGHLGMAQPSSWRRDAVPDAQRTAKAEAMLARVTATLRTTAGRALTGYAEQASTLLTSARPRPLVLFHHVHLTNNRLGLTGGEEAQIARLLWLAEHRRRIA
ncbi:thiopeptide-type bacteriocin biosynthesis protein [Streptomyces sp. NPDC052301]|uniref:thiopeptide-type bacteriocin biosynthesis protein n=1 Tax=Streptomyces sp. NPDC052301 TaxID=3365687 RepID=UPI0037D3FFE3